MAGQGVGGGGCAVNVHSAGDLSSLPSRVQNVFPQLRRIAPTGLFVHFGSDQMKREQGRATQQLSRPHQG